MKKLIVIALALTLFAVPVMAQQQAPTPEQRIEQLTQAVLDFKFKLGQEMQIAAQQQAQIIQLQKQLIEAEEKLAKCNDKMAKEAPPEKQE